MTPSTMTLDDFLGMLPRTLRQRYSGGAFPWRAGNQVLGELEKELEDSHFIGEQGLLLEAGKTDYVLHPSIRKLRGISQVLYGDVAPYRGAPIGFMEVGQAIRLDRVPILSEEEDISGTVPAGGPGTLGTLFDDTAGKLDSATWDENALAGRLLRVTHASGTIEWRILSGNTPESHTVSINGRLDAVAAEGDTYLITANYYLLEVLEYLPRLTATTDTVPIPEDWESCFLAGLRYYFELQSEEGSQSTNDWAREWKRHLLLIKSDGRHRPAAPVRRGRPLPPFFS